MADLLDKVNSPEDIRKMQVKELDRLCEEIRQQILEVTSENGGHLASSLGVVELTVALHRVFNTPNDRIIWDVGHQAYAHKIITGRKDSFSTLRTCGGISGFPKITESPFDSYNVGHSSTSLSLAAGEACARELTGEKYAIVPVIGDGSMTGGMSFEALNHIGHIKKDITIILNDNEHSISRNVGALSEYFTYLITGQFYNKSRRMIYKILEMIPGIGKRVEAFVENAKRNIKGIIIPGKLFEDLGIRYFGPVDGHDLPHLIDILSKVKHIKNGPKIIHVYTRKGKGYSFAEKDPGKYHGVSPFVIETGELKKKKQYTYSHVAGKILTHLAGKDQRVCAVTAAMTSGTGLDEFALNFPDRLYDVGIAEQHAVTFSAALARNGCRPFFAVYSTFLQRAYDQIIHDVAAMNLPVTFLIDRSGIVGEDGETHHGLFDISFLYPVPGLKIYAPSSARELAEIILYAYEHISGPVAIKYPRMSVGDILPDPSPYGINPEKLQVEGEGTDAALVAYGINCQTARETHIHLKEMGINVRIISMLQLKPLLISELEHQLAKVKSFFIIEDQTERGGLADVITSSISPELRRRNPHNFNFPSEFICHGTAAEINEMYGLLPAQIAKKIAEYLNGKA